MDNLSLLLLSTLWNIYLSTSLSNLTIQSCVKLNSLTGLSPYPSSGQVSISIWVDNDRLDVRSTTPQTASSSITFSDDPFCFNFSTNFIRNTTWQPDYAQRVQFSVNDLNTNGYKLGTFPDYSLSSPKSSFSTYSGSFTNGVSVSGTLSYDLYHQATGGKIKISNRNFLIYTQCFQLYQICFYLPGSDSSSTTTCQTLEALELSPDNNPIPKGNLETSNTSATWPKTTTKSQAITSCWQPHQQYAVFDISTIAFSSIGIGISGAFSTSEYQDSDGAPPYYYSISFGDSLLSTYTNDFNWQNWVVDLSDTTTFPDENGDASFQFYSINPLALTRDTDPSANGNRLSRITSGIAEIYTNGLSVYYKNNQQSFTTWTAAYAYLYGGIDNSASQLGQMATIACENIFETSYSALLSTGTTDCFGTGDSNCITDVFYPPWRVWIGDTSENYCDTDITGYTSWTQCTTNFVDCAPNDEICDDLDLGTQAYIMGEITCNTPPDYTNSIEPTPAPSPNPTYAPTDNPTTSPTDNPTNAPTDVPTEPGETPQPSDQPSATPTVAPTDLPTVMNATTLAPSLAPSTDPTDVPSTNPTSTLIITSTAGTTAFGADTEGEGDEDDPNFITKNLIPLAIIVAAVIICCVIMLIVCAKCRKRGEKDPRKIGSIPKVKEALGIELEQRQLSKDDGLKPERIRPDEFDVISEDSDKDEGLYDRPGNTSTVQSLDGGDPAVTGYASVSANAPIHNIGGRQQSEGESQFPTLPQERIDRQNSNAEGIGGDPAVTGKPTNLPPPNDKKKSTVSLQLDEDSHRLSVASNVSDASDVFGQPDQQQNSQFKSTLGGPDQALEVLMENPDDGLTAGGPQNSTINYNPPLASNISKSGIGGISLTSSSQEQGGNSGRHSVASSIGDQSVKSADTLMGMDMPIGDGENKH